MTVIINTAQLRAIALGTTVRRATATLPATATTSIFTISGGNIILTSLVGEVTTIVQAQTCLVKFTSTPTAGSAVDLCINTAADITGLEVGGKICLPATVALKTVIANAGSILLPFGRMDVLAVGNLGFATSATNTGSMKFTMTYIPLDDAATVVAA